jgi:tetratricopeptide (TPR) repeat protein
MAGMLALRVQLIGTRDNATMILFSSRRATNLHNAGVECSETGNEEGAIENYNKALALDPKRGETLYNLGLIYKYRGAWAKSFEFNARARAFQPSDEATLWNLAIAATALRDWSTARDVWRSLKIITEDGEGPINEDRSRTPVRVNADGASNRAIEVVWSKGLCPVRSRILNIPTGATGFRYGDIVLHDGAPVGYRLNEHGQERPVFNVLELFEPSRYCTYEAAVDVGTAEEFQELEGLCESAGIEIEDWTASLKSLCKACSEGRPHEGHDQELRQPAAWSSQRRVGFAAVSLDALNGALRQWEAKPGRSVAEMQCTLEAAAV